MDGDKLIHVETPKGMAVVNARTRKRAERNLEIMEMMYW